LIRVHTNRAIFLRGARSESVAYARANPTEVEGHPDWKFLLAERCADKGSIYPTRGLLVSSSKRGSWPG